MLLFSTQLRALQTRAKVVPYRVPFAPFRSLGRSMCVHRAKVRHRSVPTSSTSSPRHNHLVVYCRGCVFVCAAQTSAPLRCFFSCALHLQCCVLIEPCRMRLTLPVVEFICCAMPTAHRNIHRASASNLVCDHLADLRLQSPLCVCVCVHFSVHLKLSYRSAAILRYPPTSGRLRVNVD